MLVVNGGVLELFAFGISSAHADSAAFGIGRNDYPSFGSGLSRFLHDEIQCGIIQTGCWCSEAFVTPEPAPSLPKANFICALCPVAV